MTHNAVSTAILNQGGLIIPTYGRILSVWMLLMTERKDIVEMLFYPAAMEESRSDRYEGEKVDFFLRSVCRMVAK